MSPFRKAEKRAVKLRAALCGPTGAGKTKTALLIARGLVGPQGRIAVIDTEHGTAEKFYARDTDFDTAILDRYQPNDYVQLIRHAHGYDALIIDSLSHAWTDGVLQMVDDRGGKFDAWRHVTPHHNQLVDALLTYPGHLIVTMRARMAYEVGKDEKTGKNTVEKLGLKPVQREGMEYELDLVMDIDQAHRLTVSKSRISDLADRSWTMPGPELGEQIAQLIGDGIPERGDAKARARELLALVGDANRLPLAAAMAAAGIESGRLDDDAVWDRAQQVARDVLTQPAAAQPEPPAAPPATAAGVPVDPDPRPITATQRTRMFAIANEAGWTEQGRRGVIQQVTGDPDGSGNSVTRGRYEEVCTILAAGPQPTADQTSMEVAA